MAVPLTSPKHNNRPSMRRRSIEDLNVGLSLSRLQRFIAEVLVDLDATLAETAADAYLSLLEEREQMEALSQLEEIFSEALSKTNLPPSTTFEIHSIRGLTQEALSETAQAQQSFTKALWMASFNTSDIPQMKLAWTMHQLARTYAQNGQDVEASKLMAKAIKHYEESSPCKNDCLEDARRSLAAYKSRQTRSPRRPLAKSHNHMMPSIEEESDRRHSLWI